MRHKNVRLRKETTAANHRSARQRAHARDLLQAWQGRPTPRLYKKLQNATNKVSAHHGSQIPMGWRNNTNNIMTHLLQQALQPAFQPQQWPHFGQKGQHSRKQFHKPSLKHGWFCQRCGLHHSNEKLTACRSCGADKVVPEPEGTPPKQGWN